MKTLKTILTGFTLILCQQLCAQQTDPAPDLPYSNKIEISPDALEKLFHSPDDVAIVLEPGFELKGKVKNRTDHGNSVTSLLIDVASRPGGTLSISRYQDAGGKIYYSAHLLKLHEHEGMLLVEKDKRYYFIETQQRFLVSE